VTRRRLIFHPKVEEDLEAIIAHYAVRDPALPGREHLVALGSSFVSVGEIR